MNFSFKALSIAVVSLLLAACHCCKKGSSHDQVPGYESCKESPTERRLIDKDGNCLAADRVFFAFDKSDLSADSKHTLDDQQKWFVSDKDTSVTITGHCDERGTREYNIGLGERRANAAKEYLVMNGVDASRIAVVSKGKDDPIVPGSTEEAWAQNRVAIQRKIRLLNLFLFLFFQKSASYQIEKFSF